MKRRTVWIIVGVAMAAAVVATAVWLLIPRGGSAEDQARAYLQALERGDVAAVQATGLDVPPEAAAAFAAASEYISDVRVGEMTESGSSASVSASFSIAGERVDTEIPMVRSGGRWVPDQAAAFGSAQADIAVAVGDAVFAAGAAAQLLPAQYEMVASPAEFLAGNATVQITPGSSETVAVEGALTPAAAEHAQDQLTTYLEMCTEPATAVAASCGISIPWAADLSAVSSITYRIEQLPTVTLTLTSFQAGGGVLVATVNGTSVDDGSETTVTYRTSNWALRGDVAFTDDDIVLSVW
ncbi:hypothetical protein [Microbacterium sp.]|uniref:hypothetical protein n=1 Tax=Microbacterium sp. TaxID=51671 RepID=UPI002637C792|nr:hypothetical protein [Microbacterium sp.]